MAEEIQIISTLDNTQTLDALLKTEQAVSKSTSAVLEANAGIEKTINTIVKESKAAQKSMKALETSSEQLTESLKGVEVGSKEFNSLKGQLISVNKEIKNLELSFEALDSEQVASEVGSVVGGLTDVATGSFLALGVAEESAEEFFKTLAQVEGAGRLVKGSIESLSSGAKLYNNVIKNGTAIQTLQAGATTVLGVAQKGYALAVGTSTGALKLFRLALIGTGIGAIVVGIGLLIANFDLVKNAISKAIDNFDDLGVVMKVILWPITLLIEAWNFVKEALQELGIIDSEETIRAKENAAERVEATKEEGVALGEKFDFEIRKAKAAGKDTIQLEKEKRKAVLDNLKAQADAIITLVRLTGEFNDEQRDALKDLVAQAKKLRQDETVAVIEEKTKQAEKIKEANEEAAKQREKLRQEQLKAEEQQAKDLLAIAVEMENLRIAAIEDITAQELAQLDQKFDARIEKLQAGGEEEIALAVALEQEKARQIAGVEIKAAEEKKTREDEAAALKRENTALLEQAELDIKRAKAETEAEELAIKQEEEFIAAEEEFLNSLLLLEERDLLTTELELELAEAKELSFAEMRTRHATEQDTLEETNKNKAIARATQERNQKIAIASTTANAMGSIAGSLDALGVKSAGLSKAIAIGQIAINTAKGIAAAVSSGASMPFPANIPAIIAGVAAVLSGIVSAKKALSSAKLPAGAGGGGGSVSIPSAPSITAAPSLPTETLGAGDTVVTDGQSAGSNQTVKAFVVESEVTDEQAAAKLIEEKSELT